MPLFLFIRVAFERVMCYNVGEQICKILLILVCTETGFENQYGTDFTDLYICNYYY